MHHITKTKIYDTGDGKLAYRCGVMLFLLNADGKIFAGKRTDSDQKNPHDGWQVPQGGIDKTESAHDALWRELSEEIGLVQAELIAEYPEPLLYDFPDYVLTSGAFSGKYRGQMQQAFLLALTGAEDKINITQSIDGEAPEFCAYEWKTSEELRSLIVSFKRPLYDKALEWFAPYIERYAASTKAPEASAL